MASIINASSTGSGGIVQTADASGVLQLQSNGTTALSTSGANVTIAGTLTAAAQSIAKASLPTGSVLQVVNASYSTGTSTASSAYIDTGLTATITPTSATSKILVIVDQNGVYADGSANGGLDIKLLRGATTLALLGGRAAGDKLTNVVMSIGSVSSNYLDSPATTSATTYKTQFLSVSGAATVYVQTYSAVSTITLMEIAA
jgi:hypothetical protein